MHTLRSDAVQDVDSKNPEHVKVHAGLEKLQIFRIRTVIISYVIISF